MNIEFQKENNFVLGLLAGKLNSGTVPQAEESLQDYMTPQSHFIMDCEDLDYISSAGLRLVLSLTRAYRSSEWQFILCGLQEHVYEVFEISGFDSFVTILPNKDAAVGQVS